MATIRDVARAADVSIATVSRVFNSSCRVSEDTARRVWSAAAKLDYWPNSAAQSLTTSRTNVLGVLLPDLFGEFFSEVIRGLDHAAHLEQFQILISSSHANSDQVVLAARSMRGRIDGLIIMAPDEGSAEAVEQIRRRFPVVLMTPRFEVDGCGSVSIANFEGALAAVRHLLRLGHREIAVIKGPAGNVDAEERLRGFRAALQKARIDPASMLELAGDFTELAGYSAATEILAREPRPTAVFAANDSTAIGLISALQSAGIGIPEDIAVVGFDNVTIGQYVSPPLTTVRVDAYGLGRQAVRLLLSDLFTERSAETPSCSRVVLPVTLVVRDSCGAGQWREELIQEQVGNVVSSRIEG